MIDLLETFEYPVYRQGSFSEEQEYPEHFFTFWNNRSPDHAHYSNRSYGTEWDFDVFFYSVDPELTYSVLSSARDLLKFNNWIVPSNGYDVNSDQPSHFGRGIQILFLETE